MRINWIAIIRTAKLDCPVSVRLPFPARTGEGVPDGVMAAAKKERGSTDFLESLIFNSIFLHTILPYFSSYCSCMIRFLNYLLLLWLVW